MSAHDSAVCAQMPYLTDRQAAGQWLDGRTGIAILTINDATRRARAGSRT